VQEFQCLRFPPVGAGVLGDNQVKGAPAQPFGKLLGSYNYFCADREMQLVEHLQAALYFRYVTMNKEDVQRRISAFRSTRGVSLEAGWRGRSHWNLGKIHGDQSFPLPCWPRECFGSKHLKSTTGGYQCLFYIRQFAFYLIQHSCGANSRCTETWPA